MQNTVARDKMDPNALVKERDRLETALGVAAWLSRDAMTRRQRELAERIDTLDKQIEALEQS